MSTLDEVYRKFGEVAEAAQLLETELGTMQLCVQGIDHELFAGDKGELATEIYNKINKSTLGQLLRQHAKSADFSGDLELLLAKALAERNQLFHSFYRKHNFRRTRRRAVRRCSKTLSASTRQFLRPSRQSCDSRVSTWISWRA